MHTSRPTRSLWLDTAERPSFDSLTHEVECDVVIVGGGITGLTCAYALKQAGKQVVVIERSRIAHSTSGHTTGHLTTVVDTGYPTLLKRYGRDTARAIARGVTDAIDHIFRTAAEVGVPNAAVRVPGYYIGEYERDRNAIARQYDAAREVGLAVHPSPPSNLPFSIVDGFRVDDQGELHAGVYLSALARAVHDADDPAGCKIFEHTTMTGVDDAQSTMAVKTDRGTVRARQAVVLATHTPAGVHAVHGFLEAMRSYVIVATLTGPVPHGLFWTTNEPYEYIRDYRTDDEHFLIVGGADTKTGAGHEDEAYRALETWVRGRFDVKEVRYRWSSQFYEAADGLPVVGPATFRKRTYVATGFSGDGLTFGTLSALMIRDDILGRAHPLHPVFKPARFHLAGLAKAAGLQWNVAKNWVRDRLRAADIHGLSQLSPGHGAILKMGRKHVAVYRDDDGRVFAVDPTCTHLKCRVHFNNAERTWDCPCHGSRFDPQGSVLQGPATEPLRAIEIGEVPVSPARQPSGESEPR